MRVGSIIKGQNNIKSEAYLCYLDSKVKRVIIAVVGLKINK